MNHAHTPAPPNPLRLSRNEETEKEGKEEKKEGKEEGKEEEKREKTRLRVDHVALSRERLLLEQRLLLLHDVEDLGLALDESGDLTVGEV